MAVPANPFPFAHRQPDGSIVMLRLVGDEHGHLLADTLGREMTIDSSGRAVPTGRPLREAVRALQALRRAKLSAKGPLLAATRARRDGNMPETRFPGRIPIILVSFADKAFSNSAEAIWRQANAEGYDENGATGSAREYVPIDCAVK